MKKLIVICALALFEVLNAQSLNFGLKAGYLLTNWNVNTNSTSTVFKSKSGFYVGALTEYRISPEFGVQLEAEYASLGAKLESPRGPDDGKVVVKHDHLVIPLAAKYYPVAGLGFAAGPYVAFRVSNNVKASMAGASPSDIESIEAAYKSELKHAIKSTQFGAFVGAEYSLPVGLFFDVRYSFGLNNIFVEGLTEGTARNNFLQVGVGYRFK